MKARKKKEETIVLSRRFENNCLGILLSDWYILLPEGLLNRLSDLNGFIMSANSHLDLWPNENFADSVEKALIENLPIIYKESLKRGISDINRIRTDYMNDNYHEIEAPPILLASPEHEEYLKLTK